MKNEITIKVDGIEDITARCLFDITESGDSSQDPVVGGLDSLEPDERDVVEICATRLLVHWALVQARILQLTLEQKR